MSGFSGSFTFITLHRCISRKATLNNTSEKERKSGLHQTGVIMVWVEPWVALGWVCILDPRTSLRPTFVNSALKKIYPFENSDVSRFTSFCLMNATWLRVSFQLIFPLELLKSVPRARASKFATEQRCADIAFSVSILSPSRYSYDDFPSVFAANYPTID